LGAGATRTSRNRETDEQISFKAAFANLDYDVPSDLHATDRDLRRCADGPDASGGITRAQEKRSSAPTVIRSTCAIFPARTVNISPSAVRRFKVRIQIGPPHQSSRSPSLCEERPTIRTPILTFARAVACRVWNPRERKGSAPLASKFGTIKCPVHMLSRRHLQLVAMILVAMSIVAFTPQLRHPHVRLSCASLESATLSGPQRFTDDSSRVPISRQAMRRMAFHCCRI